jgi:diaminohydroxyphosphoribosylaminopyrimidine deaminase/5-amino-6-(5-phosphoribosylamino)uracil reductase
MTYLERALELAERGRLTTRPNPIVGAVVVADGEVVGEGWHERKGGPHAEVVALQAAGDRARGATLYVTMEPCAHHGTTPPCTEAVLAAGVSKVVAGSLDPNPEARGGLDLLRERGIEVELEDTFQARAQNEAWRTWIARKRPFVTLKLASARRPCHRARPALGDWGGEPPLVHEQSRAAVDAVSPSAPDGPGGRPATERACRRYPASHGGSSRTSPLPEGSELELRPGPLEDELATLAVEGVQSLLLEGGPTLATAFLEGGLVDKLLLFVAPELAGAGPPLLRPLAAPIELARMTARPIGEDLLISAYVHEP